MEKIEIYGAEAKRFHEHISDSQNCRIIFSAPYGYGKTTFLKQISSIESGVKEFPSDKYNFFHICPVNYSVASNEDIFQYIKYDLIYSLIENKFPLTSTDFSIAKGMKKYLKSNAHILASKLLLFVPNVGKDLHEIFDELNQVKDEIIDACEEESKGELDKFSEYLTELQNKTGSVYEFDIFTKAIHNVLKRIKKDEEGNDIKQNVLVIDDLDRIDPAHIFRILNVFSAHLDKDGEKNKFGFDKVVIVCDLLNIRKIYSHIYGQSVDFNGYIDKFYSSTVFEFANIKVISDFLSKEIQKNGHNKYVLGIEEIRLIVDILVTFIVNGKLNLRRLKNISSVNIDKRIQASYKNNHSPLRQLSLFEISTFLIEVLGSYDNLINTLEELAAQFHTNRGVKDSINDFSGMYMNYILPILVADEQGIIENNDIFYIYHEVGMSMKWKSSNRSYILEQRESTKKQLYRKHLWNDFILATRALYKNQLI